MPSRHTSSADWQAAAELIGDAALADSFDELRAGAVPRLHRLFRTDFVTFDHWDNHGRMLSYCAQPDPGPRLANLVEPFKAHFHEHPMLPHWQDFIEGKLVVHLSELMPVRQFLRTGLWNEAYRHQGVKYQISIGGRLDAASTWAVAGGRLAGDFGPRDRELCRFLQPRLARLTAGLAQRERGRRVADALRTFFSRTDAAYAIATASARLLELSTPARRALIQNVPGGMPFADRLPPACAELRAVLAQNRAIDGAAPAPRFTTVRAGRLQAFVLRLEADGTSLLIFQASPESAAPGSSTRLTRRESEILGWIAEGKTNGSIGALLGISVRTVEKHCENLFAKLGVENRLGAALLGRRSGGE